MSLPPLPEPGLVCNLSVYYGIAVNKTVLDPLFGTDQMREYGALCRKMALEEAENKCRVISNKYAFGHYGNETDTADECADAIREILK